MAPILSFTAEELWQSFTGQADDSVFFHTIYTLPAVDDAAGLLERWARLRELRDLVRKQIEELRAAGKVGSSLQAEVALEADGEDYERLASLGEELKYLLLTSRAVITRGGNAVKVQPSSNPKCERCWHYRGDVNGEGLCARCQANLRGPGEPRAHV